MYIGTGNEVILFFAQHRAAHPTLTVCMQLLTDWGNPVLYAVYAALFYRATKTQNTQQIRYVFYYVLIQLAISLLLVRFLKICIGRPRPDSDGLFSPFSFDSAHNSMPSGHTTEITGAIIPLALLYKNILATLGFSVYMGLVGFSRIYLGMHHTSDVFAGMAIGSFAAYLIHTLAMRNRND